MNASPSIAKLAAALVAAQKDIKAVAKDSKNPHYKNSYASLDSIIAAVRPVLAEHKLAVVQCATNPIVDGEGALSGFTVETLLLHESGEFITADSIMPLTKVDAQGAGGAMTYGRRYGLSALLALATDDDDDGNTASTRQPAQRSAPRQSSNGGGVKVMPFGKTKGKPLGEHTDDQLKATVAWCRESDDKTQKFADLITACNAILADRALGPESEIPF